jgi:hypothetical protein
MNKFNLKNKTVLASALALMTSFSIQAEVTEQSNNSFTVKHSFISNKSTSTALHEFGHVGRWWTSEFTQSGKGRNMFFNGEGMYEKLPNGKTITHLTKIEKGNKQWVWVGALGKLRDENVNAKMKISIKENHHGSKISMEYTVKTESLVGNKTWPQYTDNMLAAQMDSLKSSLNKR